MLQLTGPQPAVPVIYEPRPVLQQVSAKEIARELLNKRQYKCLGKLLGKESAWNHSTKSKIHSQWHWPVIERNI
jgi:hypothetical protein